MVVQVEETHLSTVLQVQEEVVVDKFHLTQEVMEVMVALVEELVLMIALLLLVEVLEHLDKEIMVVADLDQEELVVAELVLLVQMEVAITKVVMVVLVQHLQSQDLV